jgi:phospholipase C
VVEPNITPWRRAVCGDLTAAFDFSIANATTTHLPSAANYLAGVVGSTLEALPASYISGNKTFSTLKITLPTTQTMPVQEPGQRLARALPYQLQADAQPSLANETVTISFGNTGTVGAWFHVRSALGALNSGSGAGPWGYTVDPVTGALSDTFSPTSSPAYDLSVYGPNGFYRRFAGGLGASAADLSVQTISNADGSISVIVTNAGTAPATVTVADNYTSNTQQQTLTVGASFQTDWTLEASTSWYDLLITASTDASFVRHYAGHVETGADSVTDPLIGAA